MPLFKYFAIVGAVLLAVLLTANAFMAEPNRPVFASKFDEKTPAWLGPSNNLVTSDSLARPAPPAPHLAQVPVETTSVATTGSAPAKIEQAAKVEQATKAEKAEVHKKKTRVARKHPKPDSSDDGWDNNAWSNYSSRDNSWNGNSWSNNSWGNSSWDSNRSRGERSSERSSRKARGAYAYEPRDRNQENSWFR
jgi:hypothetical protein